ncbi:vacuolar import and degradation protein 24 [[Candida] jaroonii]|uniref:Vacuolar import and degradation protein 24 n=1 Tax=[Candida] jaroonii TaxID=467808 RepID=A0ACA9YEN8_9ASCO|nr:vacuolar import and degradation protein 24 [[Candida] jaroonii]
MPVSEREVDLKTPIYPSPKKSIVNTNLYPNEPNETNNTNKHSKPSALSYSQLLHKQPNYSNIYLRPDCKFQGLQQSGKAKYSIKVEFKTVDLRNSLVVGFLQINGLTDQYPVITTCFKGEIINNPILKTNPEDLVKRYSFITENKHWESNFKNDLDHWKKLTNNYNLTDNEFLKKLYHMNKTDKVNVNEFDDDESMIDVNDGLIYMRWKEEFLLPDARIKQIKGASFEGFYYIVLNVGNPNKPQLPIGSINGLYYHKSSEKFQSLSLNVIENNGNTPIFEFM